MQDDDDAEETLYHGTTADVAQHIFATKRFDERETYFASEVGLAEFFARRSSAKRPGVGPSVLRVVLYRSDLHRWKQGRLIGRRGFDEGDHPSLFGKTQFVFSSGAINLLNRAMFPGDLEILPVSLHPK